MIPREEAVLESVEAMFSRFLAGWASDVLEVRRKRLDRFVWR